MKGNFDISLLADTQWVRFGGWFWKTLRAAGWREVEYTNVDGIAAVLMKKPEGETTNESARQAAAEAGSESGSAAAR